MRTSSFTRALLLHFIVLPLTFVAATLVIAAVELFCDNSLSSVVSATAGFSFAIITSFVVSTFIQLPKTSSLPALAVVIAIVAGSCWMTTRFYDKSWDGMAYHQIAIQKMNEGWNPFFEELPPNPQESRYFDRKVDMHLWVNHYSKGMEMFAAAVYAVSHNIETGKVINILLLLSAFCSTFVLLSRLHFLSTGWSLFASAVAAMNPIAINQLFSYYLDGALASCLLIFVTQLCLLFVSESKRDQYTALYIIATISILLINLKFTGLVYHGIIGIIFLGCVLYFKKKNILKPFLLSVSIAGILAVVVVGFNPYITNFVNHQHPFYPLAGKNHVDAIYHMVPPAMRDQNRLERFVSSTLSRCDNISAGGAEKLSYKIPFTVTSYELRMLQSEGARLSGFGIFWSGILALTLIAIPIVLYKKKFPYKIHLIILMLTIAFTVFMNPAAWWARFVPQLWFLPLVIFLILLWREKNVVKQFSRMALVIMMINSLAIAGVYFYSVYSNTKKANMAFDKLRRMDRPIKIYTDIFSPNALKIKRLSIPYREVRRYEDLDCLHHLSILKMDICADEGTTTHVTMH